MSDLIKRLIEKRTLEAAQKQLSLKLACCARHLGSPIIGEEYVQSFLPDVYEMKDDDLPSYDEDNIPGMGTRGFVYDTMKHGVNMEVVMFIHSDKITELKCTLDGHIVFHEEDGQLQAYVPDDRWERVVESQWARAKKIELDKEKTAKIQKRATDAQKKEGLLEKLRRTWGL